jgi:hypothetical protein
VSRWSLGPVRDRYGVPARRGRRVIAYGKPGVITCGDGHHVRVRLDGDTRSGRYHPLDVDYLDGITPQARLDHHNARIDAWNDRLNRRISYDEYAHRMSRPLAGTPDAGDTVTS